MSFAYVPFKYKIVSWQPPLGWTLAQEIQMGEQVHRLGKAHFIKLFSTPPDTSIAADPDAMRGPGEKSNFVFRPFSKERKPGIRLVPVPLQSRKSIDKETVIGGLVAGTAVAATAVLAPHILAVGAVGGIYAGGMYFGSKRIAVWRYSRWLDQCLKKYLLSVEADKPNWVMHEIIPCGQCGQRLRVPNNRGRLKVICPICRTQFVYGR